MLTKKIPYSVNQAAFSQAKLPTRSVVLHYFQVKTKQRRKTKMSKMTMNLSRQMRKILTHRNQQEITMDTLSLKFFSKTSALNLGKAARTHYRT